MTSLGKVIADISRDKDDMKRSFGMAGSITNFVNFYPQSTEITNPYTLTSTRGLGSSFIVGHNGLGWIGPAVAGSITAGSQPYLGDSRGAWATKRIFSPNNLFRETFDGSRFIDFGAAETATQNTTSSDIDADDYTYDPAKVHNTNLFIRFDITAFSGKTVSSASLFMTPDFLHASMYTKEFMIEQLSIGSEYVEGTGGSTMNTWPSGGSIVFNGPWALPDEPKGVDIKSLYDINHDAGSDFFVMKMKINIADDQNFGSTVGTNIDYLYAGSPIGGGSYIKFHSRSSDDNCPNLELEYADSSTSASLASGSLYFTDGSTFRTESIYLGSSTLSNIELGLEGSTLENLKLQASSDGATWEVCNSASVSKYSFDTTGSDLRLRFEASGGNVLLTKFEAKYNVN